MMKRIPFLLLPLASQRMFYGLAFLSLLVSTVGAQSVFAAEKTSTKKFVSTTEDEQETQQRRGRRYTRRPSSSTSEHQPELYEREGYGVMSAFRTVIEKPRKSTVRILTKGKQVALGIIVSVDGFVLTKASELRDDFVCETMAKKKLDGKIVGIDRDSDLALIKVDGKNLSPVEWDEESEIVVGHLLASVGIDLLPLGVGIVSVGARKIPAANGGLGVKPFNSKTGVKIDVVVSESPAEKAGLQVDDVIEKVNAIEIEDSVHLVKTIQSFRPGTRIKLTVLREKETLILSATLTTHERINSEYDRANYQNTLGGELSQRRAGFAEAVQHDTFLAATECGGPVVGVEGKVLGINIARAGRVSSFFLPTSIVLPIIERLKSGELAPEIVNKIQIEEVERELAAFESGDRQKKLSQLKEELAEEETREADAMKAIEAAKLLLKKAVESKLAKEKSIARLETELESSQSKKEELAGRKKRLQAGTR